MRCRELITKAGCLILEIRLDRELITKAGCLILEIRLDWEEGYLLAENQPTDCVVSFFSMKYYKIKKQSQRF